MRPMIESLTVRVMFQQASPVAGPARHNLIESGLSIMSNTPCAVHDHVVRCGRPIKITMRAESVEPRSPGGPGGWSQSMSA